MIQEIKQQPIDVSYPTFTFCPRCSGAAMQTLFSDDIWDCGRCGHAFKNIIEKKEEEENVEESTMSDL